MNVRPLKHLLRFLKVLNRLLAEYWYGSGIRFAESVLMVLVVVLVVLVVAFVVVVASQY